MPFIDKFIFSKPKKKNDIPLMETDSNEEFFHLKNLTINCKDGVILEGWHGKMQRTPGNKILIYFGGRREDVFWVPKLATYLEGWNIYAFNYRGFGKSSGKATESNAKKDSLVIYETVLFRHKNIDPNDLEIVIVGRSLGTAMACWLSNMVNVDKLILLSPFSSIESILKRKKSTLLGSLLVKSKFRSIDVIENIKAQIWIIISETDMIVPHSETIKLHEKIKVEHKNKILKIQNTNHNTLPRNLMTINVIRKILNS